ncbi:MAG: MerR family transcriptional regulator [Gammaproteobacteria bacterium]|nr:MerR family transcriptional regulator [Gammaproteobacteria bacterium]
MLDPSGFELPPIPTKRYFTIGEVSKLCDVKPHVLRYWEQEFEQLKPLKRKGNRRYYQRHEVKLIRHIRRLLYAEGFTISGARTRLEQFVSEENSASTVLASTQDTSKMIQQLITELTEVQEILN